MLEEVKRRGDGEGQQESRIPPRGGPSSAPPALRLLPGLGRVHMFKRRSKAPGGKVVGANATACQAGAAEWRPAQMFPTRRILLSAGGAYGGGGSA